MPDRILLVLVTTAVAWLGLNLGFVALADYGARQREKRGIRGPWWYE